MGMPLQISNSPLSHHFHAISHASNGFPAFQHDPMERKQRLDASDNYFHSRTADLAIAET